VRGDAGCVFQAQANTLCSNDKGATRAPLRTVAEWTGLEPATSGVTGQHSNQLNYHSAFYWWVL
jgi:hypothetical protein